MENRAPSQEEVAYGKERIARTLAGIDISLSLPADFDFACLQFYQIYKQSILDLIAN